MARTKEASRKAPLVEEAVAEPAAVPELEVDAEDEAEDGSRGR